MKEKSKARVAGLIAWASFIPVAVLFRSLAISDFPPRTWLSEAYIAYFFGIIIFVHAVTFFLHFVKKNSKGIGFSRQVPRYFDYLVTVLLTVGILQITHAEGWLARHIDQVTETAPDLIVKIRQQAQTHIHNDCGKNSYFTKSYCDRLIEITKQSDLQSFVERSLMRDSDFLNHTIQKVPAFPVGIDNKSPIKSYVTQLKDRLNYANARTLESRRSAWAWVTMLLLPLVIACRAVKTSLEVFAELS
jgi:hypothetical protein